VDTEVAARNTLCRFLQPYHRRAITADNQMATAIDAAVNARMAINTLRLAALICWSVGLSSNPSRRTIDLPGRVMVCEM